MIEFFVKTTSSFFDSFVYFFSKLFSDLLKNEKIKLTMIETLKTTKVAIMTEKKIDLTDSNSASILILKFLFLIMIERVC